MPVGKDGVEEDDDGEPVVALLGREFPRRRVYVAAGLVAVLLIGGIGAGVAMCASGGTSDGGGQAVAPAVSQAAAEEKEESRVLEIGVAAEGWDEATSSPVIAHIESADGEVDFYHAYSANKAESVDVGDKASCKVTLISPVNADGSIYKVGEGKTLASSEKGAASAKTADASSVTVITIERVDADSVAAGDLTTIAGQVTEAVKKGDSTLTGDAGSKVVAKVEGNIKNSPSATDDVKQSVEQQAGQAQEEVKKDETSAKVPAASGSASSGSGSSSGTSQGGSGNTKSASSGSAGSGQAQGSGSSSGTNSSQGGSAEHQHTWVAKTVHHDAVTHTETVHHDAVTHQETVHHDAVTEQVWHEGKTTYYSICNQCGADITGKEEEHYEASWLSGGNCGSYTSYPRTTPGYYDVITLQDAYDEVITVTDRAAFDETITVTDKAAWDETTYVCSGCGASK